MKYLILFLGVLAGCDQYRYPCQNPENYNSIECNPPKCLSTDTCTKDLIGDKNERTE